LPETKIIGEIVERTTGEPFRNMATNEWFEQWVAGKAQKLTGHSTREIHTKYTDHELEALRAAVSVIPSIGGN